MLVRDFSTNCYQYENFEIWDVESMDAFFKGNSVLAAVFKDEYNIPLEEFKSRRSEIEDTDMKIMENLLDRIGDKHFYIFTLHDENHLDLVKMQTMKMMNFGVDIELIQNDHVYIIIMDKQIAESN